MMNAAQWVAPEVVFSSGLAGSEAAFVSALKSLSLYWNPGLEAVQKDLATHPLLH